MQLRAGWRQWTLKYNTFGGSSLMNAGWAESKILGNQGSHQPEQGPFLHESRILPETPVSVCCSKICPENGGGTLVVPKV